LSVVSSQLSVVSRPKQRTKKKPAGGRFYPQPARMPLHGVPGGIRSYPIQGAHPYPNPLRS
jgi:hypothetical protein